MAPAQPQPTDGARSPALSIASIDPEILSNPTAIIATNGADGRPLLSAIWYLVHDDRIKMSVTESTQKHRNLANDPSCTIVIFHPDSPDYYVEIRGDITITPDPDYAFADQLGSRYGADLRTFDKPTDRRVVLSLNPVKINVTDVRAPLGSRLETPGQRASTTRKRALPERR